ncbi:uncharacterized protein FOMMEDRAFT_155773 [Fomitiporia mediterranea MF3/22]|uniref:uncharacterized protein n=1 Tax=Fomitiporia mediterranea (strain MF3/22) TaxID=694068 RepID=UPI0004409170|nr:uncharacterized protein FOMMEDRAFT_155773 [Fomitiporia mediterranea MF3/22]EJD04620.1 hypothetical protein FOMMEDRAFT_155773 [Fomitiporia mediterranea MF3/22]
MDQAVPSGNEPKESDSKSQKPSRLEFLLHPHKHKEIEEDLNRRHRTFESNYDETKKKLGQLESQTSAWCESACSVLCDARECLPSDEELQALIGIHESLGQVEKESQAGNCVAQKQSPFSGIGHGTLVVLRSRLEEQVEGQIPKFHRTFILGSNPAYNARIRLRGNRRHQSALKDKRIRSCFEHIWTFGTNKDWVGLKKSLEALKSAVDTLKNVLGNPSFLSVWDSDTEVSRLSKWFYKIKPESSRILKGKMKANAKSVKSLDQIMSELKSLSVKADQIIQERRENVELEKQLEEFDIELRKPALLWRARHPEESLENPKRRENSESRRDSATTTRQETLGIFESLIKEKMEKEISSFYETFVLGHNTVDSVNKNAPDERDRQAALNDNRIRNYFECIRLFAEKEEWDDVQKSMWSLLSATVALDEVLHDHAYRRIWKRFDNNVVKLFKVFRKVESKLSLFADDNRKDCTSPEFLNELLSKLKSLDAKADLLKAEPIKIERIRQALQAFDDELKKPVLLWKERHPGDSLEGKKTSKHSSSRRDSATRGSQDRVEAQHRKVILIINTGLLCIPRGVAERRLKSVKSIGVGSIVLCQ